MPTLSGVHHLKFPVHDLANSTAWFERVLGARRVPRFDHHDEHGELYAVIIFLPGVAAPVELRLAPAAADALTGYDPVTFGVTDRAALDGWIEHLDALGVPHSPVIHAFIGELIEFTTPDGLALRLYTDPVGGFEDVRFDAEHADIANAQLAHRIAPSLE